MNICIYNFGLDLSEQIELMVTKTLELRNGEPCNTNFLCPLAHDNATIGSLLESVGFGRRERYDPFYILLPGDAVLAAGIIAEMYRRARRFPVMLRITGITHGETQQTKIEMIDPTPPRRSA